MRFKPVFGKRTLKTMLAVFLCAMIYILLKLVAKLDFVSDRFAFKWYNPFFASIATAYSVYPTKKESISQAKRRSFASILGGGVGIVLVAIYEIWTPWPKLDGSAIMNLLLPYTLTALMVIVIVYLATALNIKDTIFLSILTLTSVTLNPNQAIQTTWGVWVFGINRIISTIIGVLIALGVNWLHVPHFNKNKDILFVVGMGEAVKNEKPEFKGYFNYKLHDIVNRDLNLSVYTTRAPMRFMPYLKGIDLKNPVVCMSGACLYDINEDKYLYLCPLEENEVERIDAILKDKGIVPFKNTILDHTLLITTEDKDYRHNRIYYDTRLDMSYCNIVDKDILGTDVLYYLFLDTMDKLEEIKSLLGDSYYYVFDDCVDLFNVSGDLKYLKVYNKNVENMAGIKEYAKSKGYRIASLTSDPNASHLLDASEIKATYERIASEYDGDIDMPISNNSYNSLFKCIDKIYYSKEYKKK